MQRVATNPSQAAQLKTLDPTNALARMPLLEFHPRDGAALPLLEDPEFQEIPWKALDARANRMALGFVISFGRYRAALLFPHRHALSAEAFAVFEEVQKNLGDSSDEALTQVYGEVLQRKLWQLIAAPWNGSAWRTPIRELELDLELAGRTMRGKAEHAAWARILRSEAKGSQALEAIVSALGRDAEVSAAFARAWDTARHATLAQPVSTPFGREIVAAFEPSQKKSKAKAHQGLRRLKRSEVELATLADTDIAMAAGRLEADMRQWLNHRGLSLDVPRVQIETKAGAGTATWNQDTNTLLLPRHALLADWSVLVEIAARALLGHGLAQVYMTQGVSPEKAYELAWGKLNVAPALKMASRSLGGVEAPWPCSVPRSCSRAAT